MNQSVYPYTYERVRLVFLVVQNPLVISKLQWFW